MKTSAIGWTDYSGGLLNFLTGCTPVSEGCANCYAKRLYERFGKDFSTVRMYPSKFDRLLKQPFPTYSPKRGAPHKPMLFVVDTSDLFHEHCSLWVMDAAFRVFLERSDLVFQVLTKRARRAWLYLREAMAPEMRGKWPFPNVWLGVSAENQRTADERIPLLRDIPAAVHFVSLEPMLERIDLRAHLGLCRPEEPVWLPIETADVARRLAGPPQHVDWVICGGESGPGRRRFAVAWALDVHRQCREAGVAMFYKQGSGLRPGQDDVLPGIGRVQEWPA